MTGLPKLLTEPEVAEILRCSPYTVARLRKAGKLPYLPGRPVLIDEADLLAYIEDKKRKAQGPEPGSPEARAAELHAIKVLVRKNWLRRQFKATRKK
jgi:excisionase family DNA binding protein